MAWPTPIGLAGGLNLYGYAGGDPANFSDPFGLCQKEDAVCWQLVADLRRYGGATLNYAADRLSKYQGRVNLTSGPFSASTNANRITLRVGATMEGTPDGDRLVYPGIGDVLTLLAHETLHLDEDGAYPGLSHPPQDPNRSSWEPFK